MIKPKISVIIPVYNTEKYLNQSLDSILNQSYKNFEIIIVDDCSTDNSYQTINLYAKKDHRIKASRNVKNVGQGATRNNAIQQAQGEYIFFIDSDDWIMPNTFDRLANKMDSTKTDLILFKYKMFYEDQNRFVELNPYKRFRESKNHLYRLNNNPEILKLSTSPCNKLFKRSVLVENNINFSDGLYYEDVLFCFNYYLHMNNACIINESFYVYRQREGSTTKDNSIKRLDIIRVLNQTDQLFASKKLQTTIKKTYIKKKESILTDHYYVADRNIKKQLYFFLKKQARDEISKGYSSFCFGLALKNKLLFNLYQFIKKAYPAFKYSLKKYVLRRL